jgi:hypothetical protein
MSPKKLDEIRKTMDNYELGKDIYQILARLDKLEASIGVRHTPEKQEITKRSGDGLFGVKWTIKQAKSRFSGDWNPESETRLYEEVPGGYSLTVSGVVNSKPYSWGYTALYDGQDHKVWGRPDADAIEAYRINDRITIGFFKKDSVSGGTYARKLSADGKSLEVLTVGYTPENAAYFDVIQYELPG